MILVFNRRLTGRDGKRKGFLFSYVVHPLGTIYPIIALIKPEETLDP